MTDYPLRRRADALIPAPSPADSILRKIAAQIHIDPERDIEGLALFDDGGDNGFFVYGLDASELDYLKALVAEQDGP